jgi:hypothetical protein
MFVIAFWDVKGKMGSNRLEVFLKEVDQLTKCFKVKVVCFLGNFQPYLLQGKETAGFIKGSWAKKLSTHLDAVVGHLRDESAEIMGQDRTSDFNPTGTCLQHVLQDGLIVKVRPPPLPIEHPTVLVQKP